MCVFDPLQLATDACGIWVNGNKPKLIKGFSFDSRNLREGDVFLALKTDSRDGHDYVNCAFEKGASGAIVEKVNFDIPLPQLQVANTLEAFQKIAAVHRERFDGLIIGITGSCGKTTTKDLLNHLLGKRTHATLLNNNNLLGVPMTLMGLESNIHKYGIIEAGMNVPGEMSCLVSMIKPDISIITNVHPVHLDGLGTIEKIAAEKALLAQATKDDGCVIFPSSCLQFKPFHYLGLKARVIASQYEDINFPINQIIRYEINEDQEGTCSIKIQLEKNAEPQIFIIPMLSEGVAINFVLAIYAALFIDIEANQIRSHLLNWVPSKYRGQVYYYGEQIYYADCYNANPASMLDTLAIFQKRFKVSEKHLFILGSMAELGDKASQYHYNIGKSLKLRSQDRILLLGSHCEDYARGLKDAGNDLSQIISLKNKEEALYYLNNFKGTVFLKGSKFYALWELLPENIQIEESRKAIAC